MKYLYSNLIGCFVFDNQFNLVEEVIFKDISQRDNIEKKLQTKYKNWKEVPENKLDKVLLFLKQDRYLNFFYQANIQLARQKIKESVSEDNLIIQAIANVNELNRIANMLVKRLREWYSWYAPEVSEYLTDNEKFAELIVQGSKGELLKQFKLKESMGADLGKQDVNEIILLGKEVLSLYELKKKHEKYLEIVMKRYCPNVLELAGATIGARLIELGKGLKHLAMLPASTVQLLGAEKALFRHIKTGSKSPKFGVIHAHPFVQKAGKNNQGKMARVLADKLSLCARLDFFKGEFKAKQYKKELEEKFL